MMLMVWCRRLSTMIDVRIDNGIDTAMMSVLRQLPRKMAIMSETRIDEMMASRTTLLMAPRTKIDWSKIGVRVTSFGISRRISGSTSLMPSMTASVDTPPVLRTSINAPGTPSTLTELVCT